MPIKYHNFGVLVYDSAEKQMLKAISLVIEQWKNEFDWIYMLVDVGGCVFGSSDFCTELLTFKGCMSFMSDQNIAHIAF